MTVHRLPTSAEPPSGRQPPHNAEAEQAVLGAILISPAAMGKVAGLLQADDFYLPKHKVIWEAAVALHVTGAPLDPFTVETRLQRDGKDQQAGGLGYLSQLGDHCPTAANVEHYAGVVKHASIARAAIRAGEELARVAGDALDAPEAIAAAQSRLETLSRRLQGDRQGPTVILRPLDPAWLRDYPPARRWALRRPTKAGKPCPRHEGDGLLPLGKVALLVADGGVGKTMALIALGISICTGRPWLGYFNPGEDATGKVLLILAEEDDDEVHRRLFNAADAMSLDERERQLVEERLVVLPSDGLNLALADDAGDPTPDLVALRSALEATGPWSLVAADPFGQLVGLEAETSNAIATRTLRSLRVLTTVPGTPTLLLAHHASLDATNNGRARARGVTGIRNAARWEATLRAEEKGRGVFFKQSKTNYSVPMTEEIRLVRDEKGLLRVVSEEEERQGEQRQEDAKDASQAERDARREAKLAKLETDLLDRLAQLSQLPTSKLQLQALAKGQRPDRVDVVNRLLATKRILDPLAKGEPFRLASLEGTQIELPKPKDEP